MKLNALFFFVSGQIPAIRMVVQPVCLFWGQLCPSVSYQSVQSDTTAAFFSWELE